jgi:hypothetical protein
MGGCCEWRTRGRALGCDADNQGASAVYRISRGVGDLRSLSTARWPRQRPVHRRLCERSQAVRRTYRPSLSFLDLPGIALQRHISLSHGSQFYAADALHVRRGPVGRSHLHGDVPHCGIRPPVRDNNSRSRSSIAVSVRPAPSLIGTVAGVLVTRIPAERVGSRYKNWCESRRAGTIGHKLLKDWTETTEIDIHDPRSPDDVGSHSYRSSAMNEGTVPSIKVRSAIK